MYKKICLLTCFVVIVFAVNLASALDQPVAYYPMDEGSGTVVGDASGNGNDGTIVGALDWVEGAPDFGTGLDFPATAGNYVNCGTFNPSGTDDIMTVSAWFKVETIGGYQCIVGKAVETSTGTVQWQLTLNATGQVGWKLSGSAGYAAISTAVTAGEWHHVAMVKNGTDGELFIDGESVGTQTGLAAFPSTGYEYPVMIGAVRSFLFNGVIDEVAIFSSALSLADIQDVMNGAFVTKGPATGANPGNGEEDVAIDSILSWTPGPFADTHDVFFSTDFNDVNGATVDVPLGATVSAGQPVDANTFDPGALTYGTTYYWRVDEVNAPATPGTYTGKIWSFTTESEGYALDPNTIVDVNVYSPIVVNEEQEPNSTCNGAGLDANDLHSAEVTTMWLGYSEDALDPAWIQYKFDKTYKFFELLVWNYNEGYPGQDYGAKDVNITYSIDGENWQALDDLVEFQIATGQDGYAANTIVDMNNVVAKYIRLTFLSSWTDEQYTGGLSEIRFFVIPTRATTPAPEDKASSIELDQELSWKEGRGVAEHQVYISEDPNAVADRTISAYTTEDASYSPDLLLGRMYYWTVDEVNIAEDYTTWATDVWSFSTKEYNVIDDFEDYNDVDGYTVFNTWADGYNIDENGSMMGNTDTPYAENTIRHGGAQSGPMFYDNTDTAINSEVSRTFDTPLDITGDGADTFRLYYRGAPVTYQKVDDYIAMSAEGADIYGNADEFRYAYKTLTGDGSITIRVDSVQNANVWSKGGIMMRNSLDPNAMHVTTVLAASGTAELESRTEKGGTTATTDVTEFGNPAWFRITRAGNEFTAELSKDGVEWRSFAADANESSKVTIEMGNTVYVGFVVTSHQADTLAGVTFYKPTTTGNVSTGDWTVKIIGADTEMADGSNTIDKLYVRVEDSSDKKLTVYAPIMAVAQGIWDDITIPYSDLTAAGVNLKKISKIVVGVGDPDAPMNGKGKIYIDDVVYGHPLED